MKKEVQAEKLAHKGFCGFSTRNPHETGGTGVPFLSMVHKKNGGFTWHQFHQWKQSFSLVRCIRFTSAQRLWCSCSQSGPALHNSGFCNGKKLMGFLRAWKCAAKIRVSAVQLDLNQVMETCNRTWGVMGTCPPSGPYNFHGTQARRPPLRFLGSGIGSQRWDYMNICIDILFIIYIYI